MSKALSIFLLILFYWYGAFVMYRLYFFKATIFFSFTLKIQFENGMSLSCQKADFWISRKLWFRGKSLQRMQKLIFKVLSRIRKSWARGRLGPLGYWLVAKQKRYFLQTLFWVSFAPENCSNRRFTPTFVNKTKFGDRHADLGSGQAKREPKKICNLKI